MPKAAKQQFLSEEMKPKVIKEIEDAAGELFAFRSERLAKLKKEQEWEATLAAAMQKHNLQTYRVGALIVTLEVGKVKAKVTQSEAGEEDGSGDSSGNAEDD